MEKKYLVRLFFEETLVHEFKEPYNPSSTVIRFFDRAQALHMSMFGAPYMEICKSARTLMVCNHAFLRRAKADIEPEFRHTIKVANVLDDSIPYMSFKIGFLYLKFVEIE